MLLASPGAESQNGLGGDLGSLGSGDLPADSEVRVRQKSITRHHSRQSTKQRFVAVLPASRMSNRCGALGGVASGACFGPGF